MAAARLLLQHQSPRLALIIAYTSLLLLLGVAVAARSPRLGYKITDKACSIRKAELVHLDHGSPSINIPQEINLPSDECLGEACNPNQGMITKEINAPARKLIDDSPPPAPTQVYHTDYICADSC